LFSIRFNWNIQIITRYRRFKANQANLFFDCRRIIRSLRKLNWLAPNCVPFIGYVFTIFRFLELKYISLIVPISKDFNGILSFERIYLFISFHLQFFPIHILVSANTQANPSEYERLLLIHTSSEQDKEKISVNSFILKNPPWLL